MINLILKTIKTAKNISLRLIGEVKAKNYDISETVVISGSPRSGTTWLAELFAMIPGASVLWEPLHIRNQPELEELGFTWRTIIDPNADWSDAERLFSEILSGRRLNIHTAKMCGFESVWNRKFWVVKFVRANGLLNWLTQNYPVKPPIAIIRHPCAVISSQMHRRTIHQTATDKVTLSEWQGGPPDIALEFLKRYPQFERVLNRVKTWDEILTAVWCMDNYHIVRHAENPFVIILPYEKLVLNGKKTLRSLIAYLNLPWDDVLLRGQKVQSSTVVSGPHMSEDYSPLTDWKSKLITEQIERILSVVNEFGLNFYSEAIEPDYDFLNSRSKLSF
ncbi:sulfotransferase domain protein [bacterium BMS3Bbin08]|nr:sulfotransferase domain protein [bacterium BMS3Bbin08]